MPSRCDHADVCRSVRPRALLAIAMATMAGLAWGQPDAGGGLPPAEPPTRRAMKGEPTALGFRGVTVDQLIPFITKATGKVVLPQQDVMNRRITVVNDEKIPLDEALDMVFLALASNGVAVVETDKTITLRDIGELVRTDLPVLGPEDSSLERVDLGSMVEKVFAIRNNDAKTLGEALKDSVPDFAKLRVDETSNQIAIIGTIAQIQRFERLVRSFDRPAAGALQTETYRLRFADAESIKSNIEELFSAATTSAAATRQERQRRAAQQNQNPWRGGGGEQPASASSEIRVSANTQQNAVTVVADPAVLEEIRGLINSQWDLPLPEEVVVPKIYDLKHSDPVKVRTLLEGLFGRPSTTGGGGGGQNNQNQGNRSGSTQGVGRLAGQFSFQAIPEAQRLVVIAKSPDNIAVIDKIIEGLDQPQTAGLPAIIELKHASAEDLAEQLNALLAQDGTLAVLRRAEAGLSDNDATASPFAQNQTNQQATTNNNNANNTAQNINFWWQRSQVPTDRRNASNLVGLLRIVPVWRQNAVMVVAPPEYKQSVVDLIEQLDRPGRQVLISAIVAEVSRDDALALGLRWSNQAISTTNPDNAIGVGVGAEGSRNNWATSLFDTSVLNVNADINLLLQALAQKTSVNIMSEPRVFTSDNQEASFFDGQDIPFVTDTQTSNTGSLIRSFDYRAVGLSLRVRPRITVRGDVDLRVNVELSQIVPGQSIEGQFLVDRRETSTQLIVKDQQTIVISGILRAEDTQVVRKVPLLGDIPLLGELFKSRENSKQNTELLIFITPVVVENTDANDELNAPFRERLDRLRDTVSGTTKDKDAAQPATPGSITPITPAAPASEPTPAP